MSISVTERQRRARALGNCQLSRFSAQGFTCPGVSVKMIEGVRICAKHLRLLAEIKRDASGERPRHPVRRRRAA